MKTVIVNFQTP